MISAIPRSFLLPTTLATDIAPSAPMTTRPAAQPAPVTSPAAVTDSPMVAPASQMPAAAVAPPAPKNPATAWAIAGGVVAGVGAVGLVVGLAATIPVLVYIGVPLLVVGAVVLVGALLWKALSSAIGSILQGFIGRNQMPAAKSHAVATNESKTSHPRPLPLALLEPRAARTGVRT